MNLENDDSLEYRSLKDILARLTDTPLGAQLAGKLAPSTDSSEIQKQFRVVEECLELLSDGHAPRFSGVIDTAALFEKLRVEGAVLSPKELLQVLGLLVCSD